MSNPSLYDKFDNYSKEYEEYILNQPYYSSSLKEYYGDLLPITEIDIKFEDMILDKYHNSIFHVKFLVLNMQKTSQSFKDRTQSLLLYLYIQDLTEDELIINKHKNLERTHDAVFASMPNFFDEISRDFSPEAQTRLITGKTYLIKMIKNPTETAINLAINNKEHRLYKYLRRINYPISASLHEKIRYNFNNWYSDLEDWNSINCSYLIDELLTEDRRSHYITAFNNWRNNPKMYEFAYNYITTLILNILKEDQISSMDLYRLEHSYIGKTYFLAQIKSNQNYKSVASIILQEIEEASDE